MLSHAEPSKPAIIQHACAVPLEQSVLPAGAKERGHPTQPMHIPLPRCAGSGQQHTAPCHPPYPYCCATGPIHTFASCLLRGLTLILPRQPARVPGYPSPASQPLGREGPQGQSTRCSSSHAMCRHQGCWVTGQVPGPPTRGHAHCAAGGRKGRTAAQRHTSAGTAAQCLCRQGGEGGVYLFRYRLWGWTGACWAPGRQLVCRRESLGVGRCHT